MSLLIHQIGPAVTVQDLGRPGYLSVGLSRGGAADLMALTEGAALLGQCPDCSALEMAGTGGVFEAQTDTRIALTGAMMDATCDGTALAWNASHALKAGQRLTIGSARKGVYGYLHVAGGFRTEEILGARATHLTARLGRALQAGETLPLLPDPGGPLGLTIDVTPRFEGGEIRIVPSMQTDLFPQDVLDRFTATRFTRSARANRMGVALDFEGDGFTAEGQLNILSEIIMPGDIQMTGDGAPYVLLPDCQTTGGYPRIGTVLPCDLPRVAQAPLGAPLTFRFVTRDEALDAHRRFAAYAPKPRPLIRNPAEMQDLLSYQLISGAVSGFEGEPA
ncbi:biotin-dependent carboxyltransferase family protein [Thalassococcus sp. S3]|uniref:5-oxoprolinase subunit C family protein n=1 Tax=Thalassococcus sp. S3 TaxID=2017482 RepID=UPI0010249166|nr:biotin-dependent carboxyltransferase family protein [Thalassococcus sp. S3]QBF31072.1 urea amidolyase [Thalassococcus sp. S3]